MPGTIVDLTTASSPEPESFASDTILHDAIDTAHSARLRATLQELCHSSVDAFQIVQDLLLVPEEKAIHRMVDRKNKSESESDDGVGDEDESDEDESEPDEDKSEDEDQHSDDGASVHDERAVPISVKNLLKRPRPRFATSENCNEEFDVTNNGKYDCVWHTGEREADYEGDFWADHDEDCHGRISDLEDEYPEGFIYTCCNRTGDSEGCRIGTHVKDGYRAKRLQT